MKENNGFTLIELLAVIALIALIGLVIVPSIIGLLNSNKPKMDEVTKKLVFSAAESYLDADQTNYIKANDAVYCPQLKDLVDKGFLDENLINIETGNTYNTDLYVKSRYINYKYSYELTESCTPEYPDTTEKYIVIGELIYKRNDEIKQKVYSGVETNVSVSIVTHKIDDGENVTLKIRRGNSYVNWFDNNDRIDIAINSDKGELEFTIPSSAKIGEYVIEARTDEGDKVTKNFSILMNPIILFMGD